MFCHVLKELHEFLVMMGAITIFGESSFMFSLGGYGLLTKSLGAGCTFDKLTKNKMSKDECESFYNQIRMNHLT
jgi:hypothetical protein